jgi:hypothetical protein
MAIVICSIFALIASGCASTRAPQVVQKTSKRLSLTPSHTPSSTWGLENLRPTEKTVLVDGQRAPISIDMEAAGDGHYVLLLSADRKQYKPFELWMAHGPGGIIDFAGEITWFVKVKGRNETLSVTVALYDVEESESRKTETRTLLRQFRRNYNVVCHQEECAIVLFFKKLFRFCKCRPGLEQV